MAWITPTLAELRKLVRDHIAAWLPGANATVPNSVLRVVSDANAGMAHLSHLHLDYLATELLPDTAVDWLDRHADLWLGGRKQATFASGQVTFTGARGVIVPEGLRLTSNANGLDYFVISPVIVGAGPTTANVVCLQPGVQGNRLTGEKMSLLDAVTDLDGTATILTMTGGVDVEDNDTLRARVLDRIRQPPMGGADYDYVRWAKEVPGVTRAWCAPLEMGMGTVTVRFMMDELRVNQNGLPGSGDIDVVRAHLDLKRPVAVKDFWVVGPEPKFLTFTITNLSSDDSATRAAILSELQRVFHERAVPGQTFFRSWADEAISRATGEDRHELSFTTTAMPSNGHIAVLGSVVYA